MRGYIVWAILSTCLLFRIGFLVFYQENYAALPVDVDGYWEIAGNLRAGKGFAWGAEPKPTARRAPLYPIFLAGIHWLTGGRERLALVSQAFVDAATCALLYWLAILATGSHSAGRATALLWALYLPEAAQITRFWSEPLAALLLTAGLLSLLVAGRSDALWCFGLCGALLGALALTRPVFLFLPPLLAIFSMISLRTAPRRKALCAAALLFGFLLGLGPWAVRNAAVFRAFIPATTHFGYTLLDGNWSLDPQNHSLEGTTQRLLERCAIQPSEVEADRLCRDEALRIIREHPTAFLMRSLTRILRLWFNLGFDRPPSLRSCALAVVNGGLILSALLGFFSARGRWVRDAMAVLLVLAYGTIAHALVMALGRYAFPMIPALLLLAGAGLCSVAARVRCQGESSPHIIKGPELVEKKLCE